MIVCLGPFCKAEGVLDSKLISLDRLKYPNKKGGKVIVISVNRGDNRAKRATRFMYLGKTVEDTMRGTRWQYFATCYSVLEIGQF